MARAGRPPLDPARQLERAHRILDAVAELVLGQGYDRTTIDDVARRAGVAKGTIYLHWKTRDDLLAALLRRERVLLLTEVRERAPATLSALFEHYARALLGRPLLRAVLAGDSEVLGKLTRLKRDGGAGPARPGAPLDVYLNAHLDTYVAELVERGAVRAEPGDHVLVVSSIVYGFLFLPVAGRPSDERIAELVGDTVERALGTGRPLPPGDERAVARATLDFLDAGVEIARRKLALSLEV
ncbi:helix-turn-helix domain-containing protein [Nonomuraea antimicrobica]|uniref:Helix-turn-helix domain-containing protein n=1 Tax=Nonomuraea antimicrobica TaxID=561173 RepID=A0ABP7BMN5_9ACTN